MQFAKLSTLGTLAALLPGCMVGLGQSLLVPPVRGTWAYTGTDVTVRPVAGTAGADDATVAIQESGHSGRVPTQVTATQVLLGLDLPRFRMDVAAGGLGANAALSQIDLLYKHPLSDGIRPKWRLLAGLSYVTVDSSFAADPKLGIDRTVSFGTDKGSLQVGDLAHVEAHATWGGWYAAFGLEYEVFEWLHGFVQTYGKVALSSDRSQAVTVTLRGAGGGTVSVLTDPRFAADLRQVGTLTSGAEPPAFAVLAGLALTFPSIGLIRRWVIGPGADRPPGLDPDAPAEPGAAPQVPGPVLEPPPPEAPRAAEPIASKQGAGAATGSFEPRAWTCPPTWSPSQGRESALPTARGPAPRQARTTT